MPLENALPAGSDTLLVISGLGGFQYQARGLTQTLEVIKQSISQERTINGKLVDISNPIFRKYSSKITCTDVDAPPLDGLFPGETVLVHCAASLCFLNGNIGSPFRTVVSGSEYTQGHYTFYRPVLTMMVMSLQEHFEEWKSSVGWDLDLEEI
jgi:hypothetical protein